jgi:hypothetical protein
MAWDIQRFAVVNPATGQVLAAYECTNPADVALIAKNFGAGTIPVPLPPGHPLLYPSAQAVLADWKYNGTAIVQVTS